MEDANVPADCISFGKCSLNETSLVVTQEDRVTMVNVSQLLSRSNDGGEGFGDAIVSRNAQANSAMLSPSGLLAIRGIIFHQSIGICIDICVCIYIILVQARE